MAAARVGGLRAARLCSLRPLASERDTARRPSAAQVPSLPHLSLDRVVDGVDDECCLCRTGAARRHPYRQPAPPADLEALVEAVVVAGGGGALPALFELPRAACQAIAAAAGAGALRVVSPICVARALCSLGLLRDSQFIIHFSVVVLPVVLSTV